jgi:uncharacterized protein (TIGR02598 family)
VLIELLGFSLSALLAVQVGRLKIGLIRYSAF